MEIRCSPPCAISTDVRPLIFGGEQGDALMPMLFSLGQQQALVAIQARLQDDEKLFAFLDDIYIVCTPARVEDVHKIMKDELWAHARIRVHQGKTQVWNRGGTRPTGVDALTRAAQAVRPGALVWKGDLDLPADRQGLRVLRAPIGSPEYELEAKSTERAVLLDRIPAVTDVQTAWLLLLFCGVIRANFCLRTVRPQLAQQFAEAHDENVWQCLRRVISTTDEADRTKWGATLPFSLGGLGLGSAVRIREAAHWASWADSLEMIRNRHPTVAASILRGLTDSPEQSFEALRICELFLDERQFTLPTWEALAGGERPAGEDEDEPGQPKHGWQREAARCAEASFLENSVWPSLTDSDRALWRSQRGPLASAVFTAFPTSRVYRIEAQPFRLLLCRRLRLPMPLSSRTCRCGRLLDVLGHHRAACAEAEVLGRRGFALECAAAQVCREAGGRVSTNVMVRDLDVAEFNLRDARRLEVVADGFSIFGGAQLAIDTTLVCPLSRDGTARRGAASRDGISLTAARQRKERTYPELSGEGGRARLVVLAAEVGGRWSVETAYSRSRRQRPHPH